MKYQEIIRIIETEVKNKGYILEKRDSLSTDSHYFKIYNGDCSLLFRISDHMTKSNVITLRIDRCRSIGDVQKFIRNRLNDLSYRRLKSILNL